MITGIKDVYYNVEDMARATAFYRDVLGCTVHFGDEWWTELELGGVRIGLHGNGGQPVPPVPRDAHGAHCGATLTLASTDIDADVARLRGRGVVFLDGITRNPWGALVGFLDTEGNVLKLWQAAP